MKSNKPKEWWIVPPEHQLSTTISVMDFKPAHPDHVHVIEKFAYDNAIKLIRDLKNQLKQFDGNLIHDMSEDENGDDIHNENCLACNISGLVYQAELALGEV